MTMKTRLLLLAALAVAVVGYGADRAWPAPGRMMVVGGQATPCHCTERIEP